jgi:uncharacterized membrane protein
MITIFSNVNLAYTLAIATFCSVIIFFAIWLLLNTLYFRISVKWPLINWLVEKTRSKGNSPLVKKYGLIGLALLMAIPLPTIGVYSGTVLSWLMGMNLWRSLIAVVSGVAVSNSIVLLSVFGIGQVTAIFC